MASSKLTFLGHGTWTIEAGGQNVLLDPFLDNNPAASVKSDEVEPDVILISHGHFDHISDAHSIAKRTGATVVANYEIIQWLNKRYQLSNTQEMNIGGTHQFPFGKVKMAQAVHSSQLPDGSYGGEPGSFLFDLPGGKAFFACDTALFSDLQLIGEAGIDLAVLPIGDVYTMGIDDSIRAIQFLNPKRVIPAHYNTWPPIEQDAEVWAERVRAETDAEPVILQPGETIRLSEG